MKLKLACIVALVSVLSSLLGAPGESAERVQFRDGRNWVWQAGVSAIALTAVALPYDILVETNGTYTVAGGRTRQLGEGEILGADGMLLRPDGSMLPVMDHITMNHGRVMVMRDGDYQPLGDSVQLANGTSVRPDGKITLSNGSSRRLLDGELLHLRGGGIPARDTITVQDGKVFVQKDGAMISLGAGRTIMMNNGTKVFSDGTFVDFNGRRGRIGEQDVEVIEGVIVRPR